eukprot:jgi/Mesen1/2567/ME000162S01696
MSGAFDDASSEEDNIRIAKISHVILDLDGTLLDTESLVAEVAKILVEKYGKTWDPRGAEDRLGKRPIEGARSTVEQFGLPITPAEYLAQSLELLSARWHKAKALPGVERMIRHLSHHGIPMALASSSPRVNITAKLGFHPEWAAAFACTVAGDEVKEGKPHPEISRHLSRHRRCPLCVDVGTLLSTCVARGAWRVAAYVDTANLPTEAFSGQLAEHVCGIYLGWAALAGREGIFKMVMSIGWNPYFDNEQKTMEPWLLHEFDDDFYDEELRLVIVGYIRPEVIILAGALRHRSREQANFTSLEALVERIHEDGRVARKALDVEPYSVYKQDPFLTAPSLAS